jgi:hypothetical protein
MAIENHSAALALLLAFVVAACSTTGAGRSPPALASDPSPLARAYAFDNATDFDPATVARLDRAVHARLLTAGQVAPAGTPAVGRIEVRLTHLYLRSDTARFLAGILAGRDRIASTVTVSAADGAPLGRFEVETRNLSAFGSTQGLIERHAEEIVVRLANCLQCLHRPPGSRSDALGDPVRHP